MGRDALNVSLWIYLCSDCRFCFKVPVIPYSYGQFLLKNRTNTFFAFLEAIENQAFREASEIFMAQNGISELSDLAASNLFQRIVGAIFDEAPDGSRFEIEPEFICPKCLRSNTEFSFAPNRPEFKEMAVPDVTHNRWNKLMFHEKQTLIADAISKRLPSMKMSG